MSSQNDDVPSDSIDRKTAEFFSATSSPSLEAYRDMLDTQFGLDELQATYDYLSKNFVSEFERSPFWQRFTTDLIDLNARHLRDCELNLLAISGAVAPPPVIPKPFDSVVEKTYRRNYHDNLNFPGPPETGWVNHTNWYTKLRDIVRTTVVVKYLDGVTAVSDLVGRVCENVALTSDVSMEARNSGYYAIHNVVCVPLTMPTAVGWESSRSTFQ